MSSPFVEYEWKDFDNTAELTPFQKYRIKNISEDMVKTAIQKVINQAVEAREDRRGELKAHGDAENPFKLDIGGQG